MKNLKHLFTALFLLCATVATAHDFEVGGIYYNILSEEDKTVEVTFKGTSSNTYSGSVVIPKSVVYGGVTYRITSIGEEAFYESTGLTSIEIPNSVTTIGKSAFYNCKNLTSITIPNSVTSIGYEAFYGTAWYNNQPDGVVYAGKVLYKYKGKMPSNTSITVKEGTLGIADNAFHNCDGLTSVVIGNSVTSIGYRAFIYCDSLTSVVIGNSVTSIGSGAFQYCSGIKDVYISDLSAWCNIDFDDINANPLSENLYLNDELVAELVIPEGVKEIKKYAFYGCSGLTKITIPNGVTSIGNYAFSACRLTSVVFGNSVKSIGEDAFFGCSGIKEVHINDLSAWCNIDFSNNYANPLCYAKNLYLDDELITELVIPEGVKEIKEYAFRECTALTSLVIPNSVTSIGVQAFYYCNNLISIEIGDSVTNIENYAFSNCYNLTSIEIPNSVTSIGNSAFYRCYNLANVVIGDCVTSIGDEAFKYCNNLAGIVIPNSVKSVGKDAFLACDALASVVIGKGVTSIGGYAFHDCWKLKTVINFSSLWFEEGSTSNGYIAYTADKVINAPNGEVVGDFVFSSVDGNNTLAGYLGNATELVLPEDYKGENYSISDNVFECSNFTSIAIPNSVISIGSRAFYHCSSLTSVTIPSSVTSIGDEAFYGCTALKTVINNSDLDIEKGSTSNGYVAYYADEVIKFELIDGVYTLVKYKGKEEETTTFDSWTSTNKGQSSSTSSYKYTFDTTVGSKLSFDWSVSSEANYDKLYVILDGTTVLTKSGVYSSNYEYTFTVAGSHTLEVRYTKDGSVNNNDDKAEIHNVKLTKTINKPADVVLPDNYEGESYVIGESAFENNEYVASVTIPEGVEMICDKAFSGCSNLESIVIPNSMSAIGGDAFAGTKWYDNEEDGIVYAGNVLYKYKGTMPENTAITINDGILGIAGKAFMGYSSLTSIEIPTSVTNIGNYAFDGCTGLTSITSLIPAEDLFAIDSDVFSGVDKNACTLCVPYGAKETYAITEGWEDFVNIEGPKVTITINQYGCATYCSPFALDFSEVEGLKAYSAIGFNSSTQVVTLARVMTTPAEAGIFVKGEPGEYIVPTIEECNEHTLNLLVGTLEQTTVNSTEGEMSNYKFTVAELDEVPMFYPFEDNTTFSAGKAYLQIPTAWLPATAQKSVSIRFDEGETTDIDELEGENGKLKGESGKVKTVYDLQGRVVENPTSGIYIINGKKVIIK